ncbi:MAG: hypothetical protein M0P91_09660 [Sulfuricurvum sp.]|jgi:hypothetical protein|uniref:hypothetical protein n=1 Tax=Sulfuricurvum sp. TaxID=2025608 RepID=UPI0025E431A5|nr:hypothetical protein [Sulfuricurvum sp.]MCK9373454.1 hypothetical protein [Sulfuricurvum sp.]
MITNPEIHRLLNTIQSIINTDLLPLFDSFSEEFVPEKPIVPVDWLTYIKSVSYDPARFSIDLQSFVDYISNASNFLGIKNDSVAYSRVKGSSIALNAFLTSPCMPLLPYREVAIPTFNLEVMSGQVFIIAYKPYVAGSSTTLFWELRKRVSGTPLKRVFYDANAGIFNNVGVLITKETLGNYYSGSSSYNYETNGYIRIYDV